MTVLITGANGQLGQELINLLDEQGVAYSSYRRTQLDITDKAAVEKVFQEEKPSVVYHCAAYTAVDKAEDEGKEQNWQVNVTGTQNVTEAAEKLGAVMVYISTDYVFDGTKSEPYRPLDATNPQTEYGKAKLAGEQAVQEISTRYYIIRTSWVFGQYGRNFVFTMKRLAETHPKLTVVSDQYGRPTWTRTLAEFMIHLIDTNAEYGIYHFSNDDSCSWYDFAKEILKDEDVEVTPVDSSQYPQKAKRPKNSVLDLTKAKQTGFDIPTWKEALNSFIQTL